MANNVDQFWDYVAKTDTCWLFTGSIWNNGYGMFHFNGLRKTSHRMSWELTYGKIAEGMFVLHKCDNRQCVRPSHLFLGKQSDNIADMVNKKRHKWVSGANHGMAKLTEKDILYIRNFCKKRGDQKRMSDLYGVAPTQISKIIKRKNWALILLCFIFTCLPCLAIPSVVQIQVQGQTHLVTELLEHKKFIRHPEQEFWKYRLLDSTYPLVIHKVDYKANEKLLKTVTDNRPFNVKHPIMQGVLFIANMASLALNIVQVIKL
jgi:hypothetical protein